MKIGIVGCGGVANAHLQALQNINGLPKVYGFDLDDTRLSTLAAKFEILEPTNSFFDFVSNVDAAIIATPNSTHLDILKDILVYKNIPVLSEKPLTSSAEEAKEFLKLAHPASAINFNYRFNPIVPYLIQKKQEHLLGDLIFIDITFNKNSAFNKKNLTWRDQPNQNNSSGAYGDLGSHLFDLVNYLTSSTIKKETIKTSLGTRVKNREGISLTVDDNCVVTGLTDNNTIFKIRASKTALEEDLGFHIHLICKYGEISYTTLKPKQIKIVYANHIHQDTLQVNFKKLIDDPKGEIPYWSDSFYLQDRAWIHKISGKPSKEIATIQDGFYVQELLSLI